MALLVASWQFSATAQAAIISFDRVSPATAGDKIHSGSGSCRTSSSTPTKSRERAKAFGVDGAPTCITSEDQEKQPAPDGGNSPNSRDSPNDIDDSDGGLDDLSADTSTRNHQDTPLFSVTGVDAVTLHTPGIVPILLFPVHCFYCLHEHIRERAPPCRAEALA